MSILDEIRVSDDGAIDVGIIPPDSLSQEPLVSACYPPDSQPFKWIRVRFLEPMRRCLHFACPIIYAVHQGEDSYAVSAGKEEYVEVSRGSHPQVIDLIEQLAAYVETLEFRSHNARLTDAS